MSEKCPKCGAPVSLVPDGDPRYEDIEKRQMDQRNAELEAEKNIAIGTFKSAYEDMWRFMPNCWDSLDAVESGLSKLTGKPEAAFAKEASKRVGVRRKRAKTTKEKLVARAEKADADLARVRDVFRTFIASMQRRTFVGDIEAADWHRKVALDHIPDTGKMVTANDNALPARDL